MSGQVSGLDLIAAKAQPLPSISIQELAAECGGFLQLLAPTSEDVDTAAFELIASMPEGLKWVAIDDSSVQASPAQQIEMLMAAWKAENTWSVIWETKDLPREVLKEIEVAQIPCLRCSNSPDAEICSTPFALLFYSSVGNAISEEWIRRLGSAPPSRTANMIFYKGKWAELSGMS